MGDMKLTWVRANFLGLVEELWLKYSTQSTSFHYSLFASDKKIEDIEDCERKWGYCKEEIVHVYYLIALSLEQI